MSMPVPPDVSAESVNAFESVARAVLFGAVNFGIVLLFVCFGLSMVRVLRGPTLVDRGVATDLVALIVAGMTILLTIRLETLLMFDAVLIVSVLGFVSTIAFAQYIGRRGKAA